MKIKLFLTSLVVGLCAVLVFSCSKDDEYEDFYSLDINSHTPATRSSMNDWQETGASQTLGSNSESPSPFTVPTFNDECMLWSLVTIAAKNGYVIMNGEEVTIGDKYPASRVYADVKKLAVGMTWYEDNTKKTYTQGAMPASIAADIAKRAGILTGSVKTFESYDSLYTFISNPTWAKEHPAGTYIISNLSKTHATVCNGTSKNGIKLKVNNKSSAEQSKRYTKEDNAGDIFELIY